MQTLWPRSTLEVPHGSAVGEFGCAESFPPQRWMAPAKTALTVLILFLIGSLSPPALARSLDVSIGQRTVRVEAFRTRGIDYVSLAGFFRLLEARTGYDRTSHALKIRFEGHHWIFWARSAMVGYDDSVLVLSDPAREFKGQLAAPAAALASLLDRSSGRRVRWNPRDRTLTIEGGRFNVLGFDIQKRDNGILIAIELSEPLAYECGHSEGNWINLTLHEARVETSRFRLRRHHRLLRDMRAHQFEHSAQLSFRMRRPFVQYFATHDQNPDRVSILIQNERALTAAAAQAALPPPLRQQGGPVDLIVIDAGHGGSDLGAPGRRRDWCEKDVALSIAQYAADRLAHEDGIQVLMTRNDDRFLYLSDRVRVANEAGADLFVSIHANVSSDPQDGGSQTFFWAPAANADARTVAIRENTIAVFTAVASTETGDSEFVINPETAARYQPLSAELAQLIQEQLEADLDIPGRGVDQAEIDVLAGLAMPAVVVECAFISNPAEEKLLRKESFQKDVARAVTRAILEYRKRHETTN